MSAHLVCLTEDTLAQTAKVCSTRIDGHGAPLNEAYYSSPEENMSDSISSLAHSDASTVVSSIKSLDAEDGNIQEGNGTASKETSDVGSSLLGLSVSVVDKELFRHGHSLEVGDDGDQTEAVSRLIKPNDTTATTQVPNLLVTYCATSAQAFAEVCVGFGSQIARWRRGSELCYVICEESFPTEHSAILVTTKMGKAIEMWKGIGVQFRQVERHDKATFAIVYEDLNEGAYAVSFFPRASGGKLVLFKPSLSNTDYLANILAHELGHILGLRHEFAPEKEPWPATRIGRTNANSVMNYFDHLSKYQVTEQDLKGLAQFYGFDEAECKKLSISNIDPETRTFSPPCNSGPVPLVNPATPTSSVVLNHPAVNPAMLYRARILIFIFFILFVLFMFFITLIFILFVRLR